MNRACNAIALEPAQLERALKALAPAVAPAEATSPSSSPEPDIGKTPLSTSAVEKVRTELAANPPQKFDLARKVNVFNAHVEFVEMSLVGTHIARHTAQLPHDLVFATRDPETQKRVQASFKVVGDASALGKDAKAIADEVVELRKKYLRSAGSLGSIILRSKRDEFNAIIGKVREEIARFRASAEVRLQKESVRSKEKVVEALVPAVKRTPPDHLLAQISGKPTNEIVQRYLRNRLASVFPEAGRLIAEMRLDVAFKAVTYEMLRDEGFRETVECAFPYQTFELFEEFKATPRGTAETPARGGYIGSFTRPPRSASGPMIPTRTIRAVAARPAARGSSAPVAPCTNLPMSDECIP